MPRLELGKIAPNFTAVSVNMGEITLSDYRGQKTLLIFSRYFGCPVCQYEFDELREFLKNNSLKVIYINQSFPESARKFINDRAVDFPVIASTRVNGKYELYELYGVGSLGPTDLLEIFKKSRKAKSLGKIHGPYEGIETQSPAQFLIDEEGKIISIHYGLFNSAKIASVLQRNS